MRRDMKKSTSIAAIAVAALVAAPAIAAVSSTAPATTTPPVVATPGTQAPLNQPPLNQPMQPMTSGTQTASAATTPLNQPMQSTGSASSATTKTATTPATTAPAKVAAASTTTPTQATTPATGQGNTPATAVEPTTTPAAAPGTGEQVMQVLAKRVNKEIKENMRPSVSDQFADAKVMGRKAFQEINTAWVAILTKDAPKAQTALDMAIHDLSKARPNATYHVVNTGFGTVSDHWVPAGNGGKGPASYYIGDITPKNFTMEPEGGRAASMSYERLLNRAGYQIMLPVHDARANLITARSYVKQGNFNAAKTAMKGIFDSSVKVAAVSHSSEAVE